MVRKSSKSVCGFRVREGDARRCMGWPKDDDRPAQQFCDGQINVGNARNE
jgi:hypothetical protein